MKRIVASIGMLATSCALAAETVVDEMEITSDTIIDVAEGDVKRINYLWASEAHAVTKTGAGKLVLTVIGGGTNISVIVQAGTLASARPGDLPCQDSYAPNFHGDASKTSSLTFSPAGGTNFVSRWDDADGRSSKASRWSGFDMPYVADKTQNGLTVLDFGPFKPVKGEDGLYGGTLGVTSTAAKEYFYVWEDREDAKYVEYGTGDDFNGPQVVGNTWELNRGLGGNGKGFCLATSAAPGSLTPNLRLDGQSAKYNTRVSDGFHVFHNFKSTDTTVAISTIGYSNPRGGGTRLAEIILYTGFLSQAARDRIEEYLASKWFGAKLNAVTLSSGATLDVSAVALNISHLDAGNGGKVVGWTNLVYESACGTATVVAGDTYVPATTSSGTTPDLTFESDAKFSTASANRLGNVTAGTDKLTKTGAGELIVADPDVLSDITIEGGTLTVSPLHVKGAEYHVDATRTDTIDTAISDGKDLITVWRDVDHADRTLKPTTSRKPKFDTSRLVRAPFVTKNSLVGKHMVDFGTFADANHLDGWGAELCPNKTFSETDGVHDIFAVWQDYPGIKNESYPAEVKFNGPSLFGMQYYWFRGKGGNGVSFPMHHETAPSRMYGDLRVDGVKVNGQLTPIGEGVHVLAQRIMTTSAGAPFAELGGNWQVSVKKPDGSTVEGVYGGLMIGEVLMFKDPISDTKRLRIEGALRGKWTGAVNAWSYDSLDVAAGAKFRQLYTDLRVDSVALAGTVEAASLRAETLTYSGDAAAVTGTLELADGGAIEIQPDGVGGFKTLTATSVVVSGKGTIRFAVRPDGSLLGQEIKLIDSASVTVESIGWKSTLLDLPTMRAYFVAKADGLYVGFRPTGLMMIFR